MTMAQTPLELEILKSNKLRATILSVAFFLLSLLWLGFVIFASVAYSKIASNISVGDLPIGHALVALYFLAIRQVICHYIRTKKNMPGSLQYFIAFIEVSIPTLGILALAHYQLGVYSLIMPPLLIYSFFIILTAMTLNEWICRFSGLVAALEYWAISYYIFNHTDTSQVAPVLVSWLPTIGRGVIIFLVGVATGFITSQIRAQLTTAFNAQKERDRIETIFGQHVSPEVVSKLLSEDANASKYIPVCIMFLDIRNFTHFTEQNEPAVVVKYLNYLFKYMVEIIHKNKGIINKYLGDGFMAVFGAPISSGNDVAHAVSAALAIVKRTEEEVKKGKLFDLKLGIGIHFGHAVTGTIGTKRRLEYTIVGDVVNSAAHIEQLNKTYHSNVLISEDAMNQLSNVNAEFVGDASLKHRDHPMKLYRLI
ncbi:adenylate/guanylate cyclase domain-containing protein [Legionella maceachernii]|uniref:Adenylate cyclase n=2 Tax=Legionella maceachernii TaxID=466 RepID=A0A0W0W006_9GAMM|nr:adenylate/guanylate cyclase domain-containing protein [Legionella maceachernii]KTD25876.1 adenylate cyclase [Legionella maceachernii]SJZ47495.1 Adenylate and Guanylate cyclase catalytic domain-containing protein [Legionella maceachernii]SUP03909.1 Adenylate cyclase 1 [Legionella maceachernii]